MSVAIRAITRLQDADDLNVTLGAGVDEYALCWDNDTARFVLRAPFAGLLATGATTGATAQAQTFTNGIIGPSWKPAADSTTALQLQNAAGASVMNVDTTNGRVGIGTASPGQQLHVVGRIRIAAAGTGDGDQVTMAAENTGLQMAGASTYTRGGSFQLYGETHASYPGDVYLVSGGATASPASKIQFGYRNNSGYSAKVSVLSTGLVGIGTTTPGTLLHALLTSAATNAVSDVLTIGHNTTGTAANGFGAGQLFALESSTTAAQSAARIQALWSDATHATRKADLVLSAYDTDEREGLRIRANGSAPAIGFLGATPVARIAHVADPTGGGTVDAEARSAINSILATLETFGFHATS